MITITSVWLCFFTHVVYGTIITVNNNGNNSPACCMNGTCLCSSLSFALSNASDNTTVNITSESVTLHNIVEMGSGNLTNITIIGNGATIMCNNTGGVYCESCSYVTIMGITWYQCGRNDSRNPAINTPVLNFTNISNVIIHKCTFESSSGCPVNIRSVRESILIEDSYFIANVFDASKYMTGLHVNSEKSNLNISIISSKFYGNGCRMSSTSRKCQHYGVIILGCYSDCPLVNILIESTVFSNYSYGIYIHSGYTKNAKIQLSHVNISNSTAYGTLITTPVGKNATVAFVDISFVTFMNNVNALNIVTPSEARQLQVTIKISNAVFNGNTGNDSNAHNAHTKKLGVLRIALMSTITSVAIENCYFNNNFNGAIGIHVAPYISECKEMRASITFTNVTIYNTTTTNDITYASIAIVSIVTVNIIRVVTKLNNVNFISNNYSRHGGEVLLIENSEFCDLYLSYIITNLIDCTFHNNTAFDHVVSLHIKTDINDDYDANYSIHLSRCHFDDNFGGESIVYISGPTSVSLNSHSKMTLDNSTFSNNKGTPLHSIIASFLFTRMILFTNNTANSGAAIYFEEVHNVSSDNADIQFINNTAVQKGGALYFNLVTDYCNMFSNPFSAFFINNLANVAGNSIYFSVPHTCKIITNISDNSSLLYVPNNFSYSQPVHTTSQPVVTSPYKVKLYPPAVVIGNSSNDYSIEQSKMAGEPIQFTASVFDYFNNITEPVIFFIDCKTCGDDYKLSTYQITVHDQSSHELKVFPSTPNDVTSNINISVTMLSVLPPVYKSLRVSLSIELSSCRTGYLFDKYNSQPQCICYPYSDIVHCTEQYSEVKIGYWIGFLMEHYTSSICPSNYCNFAKCTEASSGYCELPRESDDQCSSHRTGVACGECKPGYTLAYDSPDCINTDKCSAGMTILVIVLTILYWIAIVAIVFCLMYFQFQISSGYAYGIIYYYSIVDILLGNDISDGVFQLVAILSSFAKLTPQLLGQLCLVEGLSGIDQQFIHYSHALAVSLILLIIVLATRYSPRLALYVSRCIICVICLLLLLSYTSLASTSLQLLRPLTFNDVDEVHTYSSPDIKYFTGRHFVYAIVAMLCEVIIVIGLPLFLLLEPLLGRRINLVKIKPLLDQFQGCYKDKYRWFAAYYLICRQVIILIVYVGNGDYYNKLYYLQTACIIIAMIHGCVQPYKKKLVNGLDEAILLILVLVVNLNTFSFLSSVSSQLSVVLIILPLLLLCLIAIRKLLIHFYNKKKKTFYLYNPIDINGELEEDEDNDNDDNEANNIRIDGDEINNVNMYNEFREPLLNLSGD